MNLNIKRHRLLEILCKHRNNVELNKAKYNALGVTFEHILKELNCNKDELFVITAELYTSEEIGYHNAHDIVGLFARDKGLTAFSNRKYIKLWWDNLFNISKNIVQIFIPILSLMIAYVTLTTKSNQYQKKSEKELQEVKELILKQQKDIKVLEFRIEKNQSGKKK